MSYRGVMCSCETAVCVQEERRGPLTFSLPHPQTHYRGQQEAGTDVERECSESIPVVVDQGTHPKQTCFFLRGFS